MTKIIGRQDSIGIGKESTRGTAVTPTYWIPWLELEVDDQVEAVTDEVSLGVLEDSDDTAIVEKYGMAKWKTKLMDEHIGLLLLSLTGAVSSATAGGESAVYEHTYSISQTTTHTSLTLVHKNANDDLAYTNMVVDKFKVNSELGNYVMYECEMVGKASESDSNTVSHSAERHFTPQMVTVKFAADQASLSGASATLVRSVELEMSQNVFRDHVLGAEAPQDVLNTAFTCEGKVTLLTNGSTFADLQNNETDRAMRLQIVHTDTIGTAENSELLIDLYKVRITNYSRKRSLNDFIEESFDIKAHYSQDDSKMLDIVLTNEVASY